MKKNNIIIISVVSCIVILEIYIYRLPPFLPHINQNNYGSFAYGNSTYYEYTEEDFMEKFSHLKRGKR